MGGTYNKCFIFSIVCGSLMVIFSISMLAGGYKGIFDLILAKKYIVEEGSEVYDIWKNTPVPLVIDFYFFNIDNPDDFLNGAKPKLTQKGPYIYREYRQKEDIKFQPNGTVTFYQNRMWIWDEQNEKGQNINDTITILNTVPVSAAYSVRDSPFLLTFLNRFFNQIEEQPIINVTVRDILFDGVEDPLLTFLATEVVAENGTYHFLLDIMNLPPGLTDYDRFGWFYKRNMSKEYDGIYNMYTGETSIDEVGQIDLWNYSNQTTFFNAPCNSVNGSAGELWPPEQTRTSIQFYSSDLCMSIKLYYQKDMVDSFGIDGYRYWGSNETFTNQSYNPDHKCFCVDGTCSPTGLLNAESCRMGAPAFISFPHYLNADPYLLDQVEGLSPDPQRHSFFIDINPDLGIPIQVAARMQINMRVTRYHRIGHIDIFKNVPDMILPLLWFEEGSRMTQELADEVKPALFFKNSVVVPILFSLMLISGVLVIIFSSYKIHTNSIKSLNLNINVKEHTSSSEQYSSAKDPQQNQESM